MKKKKVLHTITLSQLGGAQKHVLDAVTGLRNTYDITVLTSRSGDCFLINALEKIGVPVIILSSFQRKINPWKDFLTLAGLYRYIRRERFDIVHCHSSKAGVLGRLAAKLARCKGVIFTAHGFSFYQDTNRWKKAFYVFIEYLMGFLTDAIICVSENEKQEAQRYRIQKSSRLFPVYNGISRNHPGFRVRLSRKRNNGEIRIGFANRFSLQKGLFTLFDAIKVLAQRTIRFKVLLYGNGVLKEQLEEYAASLDISTFIEWKGVEYDLDKIYTSFHILASSSLWEGCPYNLLEAMTYGVPVVATRVGGVQEMIENGKTGLLVESRQPEALAHALNTLINDNQLRFQLAKNARDQVRKKFALKTMLEKTQRVYEQVTGAG